jgi:translation initiation factor 1
MSDRRLVFSTDPRDQKCARCGWFKKDCKCSETFAIEATDKKYTVIFKIEKSGRGGKTVTVMEGWPRNDAFLKEMTKELKSKCGTGGTYSTEGVCRIEIQGDQRTALKKLLEAKGISFKGM